MSSLGAGNKGVEVAKITRALDRNIERKAVDLARVAMIGLSYRGYYNFYIATVEPRIEVAITSCWFPATSAAKDAVTEGLSIDITSPDQVALLATLPTRIQVGIQDKLPPIEAVRRTMTQARRHYVAVGKPELFDYEEFDGGLERRGEVAWPFLAKYPKPARSSMPVRYRCRWQGYSKTPSD